jgi:hypothetical protein
MLMRLLIALVLVAYSGGALASGRWGADAREFGAELIAADAALGHRVDALDRGCSGAAWLLCDVDLRGVRVRARAGLPEARVREVEIGFARNIPTALGAAAVHSAMRWAEPAVPDDERRQAVAAALQGERQVQVGSTRLQRLEGFSGPVFRLSAVP